MAGKMRLCLRQLSQRRRGATGHGLAEHVKLIPVIFIFIVHMVTYFFKPKALPSRSFKRYLLVMPVHHQCPQRSFDFGSHVDARDCRSKMMSKKLYTRCLAQANSDSFYRFIQSSWWTHDVRVQVPSAPLLSPEVSPQAK